MTYSMKPIIKKVIGNESKNPRNPKITVHPPESKVCFNLIINIATKTYFEYSASASQRAHKKATYCVIQSISIIIDEFSVSQF